MTAPTARQVLASIDRSRQVAQMQALADLNGAEEAEVRRALTAVKGGAKIDVPVLLSTIRRGIAERAETEGPKNSGGSAWLYGLLLKDPTELLKLRDDLRERVNAGEGDAPFEPGSAGASIMLRLDGIATRLRAPDDAVEEPDDEPDDEPRRRPIQRVRSRQRADLAEDAPRRATLRRSRTSAAPRAATRPFLGPRLLGRDADDRPYGCPIDVADYAAWRDPLGDPSFRPPWLLDDDDPDPDEQETDDVDVSIHASA